MVPSLMNSEEVSRRSSSSLGASLDSGFFLGGRREMLVLAEEEEVERWMKSCSLARRARRSFFSRISDSVGMEEAVGCGIRSEPNFEAMSRAREGSVSVSGSESEYGSLGVEGVELRSSLRAEAL